MKSDLNSEIITKLSAPTNADPAGTTFLTLFISYKPISSRRRARKRRGKEWKLKKRPNWVGLVNNCVLLCLDHLALVFVFYGGCRGCGWFSIISSGGSRLILCSIANTAFLGWLTSHSLSICCWRGYGSEFSESVRLVAFEMLQFVFDLDSGVTKLVFDSIFLLLRELPGPVVLSLSVSNLFHARTGPSMTYQLWLAFGLEALCHSKHIGMPGSHLSLLSAQAEPGETHVSKCSCTHNLLVKADLLNLPGLV